MVLRGITAGLFTVFCALALPGTVRADQASALSAALVAPADAALRPRDRNVAQAAPVGAEQAPLATPGLPRGLSYTLDLSSAYPLGATGRPRSRYASIRAPYRSTASLNTAYNGQIATAVRRTGAALADVHALFAQIEANGGHYPLPSNPKCCSLAYGGGFFSLDGLHPSDTGYALVANVFIAAVDRSFTANVPPLSAAQIATINARDPYSP